MSFSVGRPASRLSPKPRPAPPRPAPAGTVLATLASNITLTDDPKNGVLGLFVHSAQRAGVRNLMVAAYDQATLDWLAAHGVPALLRPPPPACDNATHWVACGKADLARDIVALGYNVLLLDTDVLLFSDPMEQGFDGSYDVESSTDGMADSSLGRELVVCTPHVWRCAVTQRGCACTLLLQSHCSAALECALSSPVRVAPRCRTAFGTARYQGVEGWPPLHTLSVPQAGGVC